MLIQLKSLSGGSLREARASRGSDIHSEKGQ